MATVEIKITGGDSAHRSKMQRTSSRIWTFPDQIDRIISLSGWHWQAYDEFIENGSDPRDWTETIFSLAQQEYRIQEHGSEAEREGQGTTKTLDEWIQQVSVDYIRARWDVMNNDSTRANQNGIHN